MPETEDDLMTMTWEDAEDALADADAALLGAGSVEQHSIHLPVSVDTLRAEHLTEELVDAAGDHDLQFVRLPTLPYGESEHHMNFAGTVTLSPDTYQDVVADIGKSLSRHGVDRLVIVNCHGGNRTPLSLAADRIVRDHGVATHIVHWTEYAHDRLEAEFGDGWGHAGEHETSVTEYYRPDLVKQEKKEVQNNEEYPKTRSYAYFDDMTEQGGLGDPTNSEPEVMDEIVAAATDDILDALVDDIDAGW